MPFRLWPAQIIVLWLLLAHRLAIILKARQLGISWLCCAYALWLCLFNPHRVVLIFSKGQLEADEMLRRVKVLYERLPDWMLDALPQRIKDNTEVQEWGNGSIVRSLSRKGGRSFTASLAILDECAHIESATDIYDQLKPTIDAGGRLIILSTANGLGNLFHRLWVKAEAGANKFKTIFLPWWSRPERTAHWYADIVAEAVDLEKVKQEYPADAQEAFISSGRSRFATAWISAQSGNIRPALGLDALSPALRAIIPEPGKLSVYTLPMEGRQYIIGADVAEGLEHGDFSAATVIDAETWEQVAELHGHWEPDLYADLLAALAAAYNGAAIAVERNNHGHAVLATLKRSGVKGVVIGLDGRTGWLTNVQTKPMSIDILATALRDAICKVCSKAALDEMQIYCVLDNGNTSAPEGYHDDRVMSWAIALIVARRRSGQRQKWTVG